MRYFPKKLSVAFFSAVFCGVVLGFVFAAPFAYANLFTDFWGALKSPFATVVTSTLPTSAIPNVIPNVPAGPAIAPSVNDYERAVIQAVKKASPAVVSIAVSKAVPILGNCSGQSSNLPQEFQQLFGNDFQFSQPCEKGSRIQEVGGGSGFIISENGLILTNKHVVSDTKASYTVYTNDSKKYEAKVLARDPVKDLAVIKIEAEGLQTVELGDSDGLELGQTVIAIGNALGEYRNTVSRGVVSGLARTVTASSPDLRDETIAGVIQTDAAINLGNSGGPLLNIKGQVIGINTAIASNAQNIGFAIPINSAKKDIGSVKVNGQINTPYLGVRYLTITPEIAKAKKLPVDAGALVEGSAAGSPAAPKDSPAEKAGILSGDIILKIDKETITPDHPLVDIINNFEVGQTVTLTVRRGSKEIQLKATLAKRSE